MQQGYRGTHPAMAIMAGADAKASKGYPVGTTDSLSPTLLYRPPSRVFLPLS